MFSRSRRIVLTALSLIALTVAASPAGEPRTHDGFLLRLSAGGGGASSSADTPLGELKVSGPAGDVNFAIGGALSPNFILHGTLWGWAVADPEVELGGVSGTANDVTVNMSAWGVGFTYYVMPANFYISPSIGAAQLTIEEDGVSVSSDTGFAAELSMGKEWWVGDNWGLGVAGGVGFHKIPTDDTEDLSGPNAAIRFTATMN